jgi:hypothetical protein
MSLEECEGFCLKNCSCTAYSNLDIRGNGSGCLLWFGNLNDMRVFSQSGQDLYVRMANSELGTFYFFLGKKAYLAALFLFHLNLVWISNFQN